jgi:predicted anti-sigma-YlaC factor YlaD
MEDPNTNELLGRLLGPAGCDACFEVLDRYVDLEVSGKDADAAVPGLRAHLEGCPACREEHESLLELVKSDERL